MDSTIEGVLLDQSKCSKLSMEEKREFVYEISKLSPGASEMLQSWTRHEILQVLCAEMGKERKYTGLTKLKIIEILLKVVSEKKSSEHGTATNLETQSSTVTQKTAKRQRKADHPSRLPAPESILSVSNGNGDISIVVYCKNSACKANIGRDDAFCKRCSCCICYQYDDNKDPSLWIVCSSEAPFEGVSCGMSCHLECALKHERSGIAKDQQHAGLDGQFYCVYCGKVNDLIGCCKKQLVMAKDTRRVDILCYRLSLFHKLLGGTKKYCELHEIVDRALKKLEPEVGPLSGCPVKMGRGIVNRLSSGPAVQKLCALAVELLDSIHSTTIQGFGLMEREMIRVEEASATSLTLVLGPEHSSSNDIDGYTLWHRKANDLGYPAVQTCTVLVPDSRFVVSDLAPGTEYVFKVESFRGKQVVSTCETRFSTECCGDEVQKNLIGERGQSPTIYYSSLSNPSSVEENNNIAPYVDPKGIQADNYCNYYKEPEKIASAEISNCSEKCPSVEIQNVPVNSVSLPERNGIMTAASSEPISDVLYLEYKNPTESKMDEDINIDNRSSCPARSGLECAPNEIGSEDCLPITPFKLEKPKDVMGRSKRSKQSNIEELGKGSGKEENPQTQAGSDSSSKKRSGVRRDEEGTDVGASDKNFEYYVKVIRWLECEGHIEKNFRQKFLTWYSLRATPQEVRIVKVFVDTFIEDPASLAGQLVDSFSDCISSKTAPVVPAGFCLKLWH